MGYFPFYIDIENKKCVVAGGGVVALRKVEKLLPFNPQITVIAPEICDGLLTFNTIKFFKRKFIDSDIDDAFMVISATDDSGLNAHIFSLCKEKNIPVNTVDDKENCSFIFPALVKNDSLTVAISTSGKCPIYSRYLREKIEKIADEKILNELSGYREIIKEKIPTESKRKEALEYILDRYINNSVNKAEIEKLIQELSI